MIRGDTQIEPGTLPLEALTPDARAQLLAGRARHRHQQQAPAARWTVTHNLGERGLPVTVLDTAGTLIDPADVQHVSENVIALTFGAPFSGDAYVG